MILAILVAIASIIPSPSEAESCQASWYSSKEGSGSATASGRSLNDGALTVAHKSLPFGSRVRVTNRSNGRSVVATVTDRGPFVKGRCVDLTRAGRSALGMDGTAPVSVERVR